MRKIVLIVGDDRLGHRAIAELAGRFPCIPIYRNRSASPKRLFKLVRRNPYLLGDFITMAVAEWRRPDTPIPALPVVSTSADILAMIEREKPQTVVCFRAGIILGSRLLASGPEFLNLHYADLPAWGGLAALPRALRAKAYQQKACLHQMVVAVDAGEVLRRLPYQLDPALSYGENEEIGFTTGLTLLMEYLAEQSA